MSKRVVVLAVLSILASGLQVLAQPHIVSVGPEEYLGANGRLPHIATDSKDQPHVVVDIGGSTVNYFYDKIGGSWQTSSYNSGGQSAQAYNPHIEINEFDQAWISVVKWYSHGMGMMLRENMATSPVFRKYSATTGGAGGLPVSNLSIDPTINNQSVVYGGNGGYWEKVGWNGSAFYSLGTGNMGTGSGGEKNYFWISKAGDFNHPGGKVQAVWHACTDWSYQNSVRAEAGKGRQVWANFGTYPYMGDDGAYPIVVSDNVEPQTAYIANDFGKFGGPGIVMNIWKGDNTSGDGHFVFSASGLLIIDASGTSGLRRFEPQLYPANNGGVWVCYQAGSLMRVRYIPSDVTSAAQIGEGATFTGVMGALCVDKAGDLHVVYNNAGIKYRKLEVSGDKGNNSSEQTMASDFDGDGTDDICVYRPATSQWFIKGSLVGEYSVQWGTPGDVPAPADFDGDNIDDICVFRPSEGNWYVKGSTGANPIHNLGTEGDSPVPGDYDGDGTNDVGIFRAAADDTETNLWAVNLSGGGQVLSNYGLPGDVPLPADYDGDGTTDLGVFRATDQAYQNNLFVYDGSTAGHQEVAYGIAGDRPVPADYDGDGATDIGIFRPSSGMWYAHGSTDGPLAMQWGASSDTPIPGDYDGDTNADVSIYRDGDWFILQSSGGNLADGIFLKSEPPYDWGIPGDVAVSDMYDADTAKDIAVFRSSNARWYIKQTADGYREVQWGAPGDIPVQGLWDADAVVDIAVYRPSDGNWFVKQSVGGAGLVNWGAPGDVPVPSDYDGDGMLNNAVYRPSEGNWYIRPAGGGPPDIVTWGSPDNGDIPVPGDYDGDGTNEVAVFRPSDGTWYIKGSGFVQFGASGDIPIAQKVDGNNITDMILFRPSDGTWHVRLDDGTTTSPALQMGAPGDSPEPGDYDGDGLFDYCILRGGGEWYILDSSTGRLRAGIRPISWGIPGDEPLGQKP
ncbi:MAG: VCBS repeat-containing protein [Verrucomicrobia bacterium]|nr:VCBS repeat-containing protein [Verrucomicrobiota bacterium]